MVSGATGISMHPMSHADGDGQALHHHIAGRAEIGGGAGDDNDAKDGRDQTQRQKQQILKNTRAFLDGREANNILLYGDKGTGKSSTVKAVANEYADRGLKIIEMSPRHITNFPKLFEQTLRSPFRFIVFLDDLTFSSEDDNFAALKAFIEGGLAGKPSNLVIYATSNRRHLIRESMADRQGDEVRVRDTLETLPRCPTVSVWRSPSPCRIRTSICTSSSSWPRRTT